MAPGVLVLLMAAAGLHAGWNILLKTASDPLRTAGRGMLVGASVLVPAGTVAWLAVGRPPIPLEAWGLAFVSGILEATYFALLSAAYARGDLSLVYPIARGTAPVLAVIVGIGFLGERLGPFGTVGVLLLLAGILSLQRPWTILRASGSMPPRVRQAVWLALATGVAIAAYSAVDRTGARLVPPWLYAAQIWAFTAVFLLGGIAIVDRRARRRWDDRAGPSIGSAIAGGAAEPSGVLGWRRAAVGGLVTVAAYLLVLVAFVYAPLAVVAPVRESAIVLVSGWGSFRLGEAATRRVALTRLAAAGLIVAGAFLLALES
jgi:drug/metabolite transporter (DMT)-like permease